MFLDGRLQRPIGKPRKMKTIVITSLVVIIGISVAFIASRNSIPDETTSTPKDIARANEKKDQSQSSLSEPSKPQSVPIPQTPQKRSELLQFVCRKHDFGTLYTGQSVSCEFEFENVSDKKLRITRVKANCGCTSVKFDGVVADNKEYFEPGEKGKIQININTGNKAGEFSGVIKVFIDVDIENPRILVVSGMVLPKPVEPNASSAKYPDSTTTR